MKAGFFSNLKPLLVKKKKESLPSVFHSLSSVFVVVWLYTGARAPELTAHTYSNTKKTAEALWLQEANHLRQSEGELTHSPLMRTFICFLSINTHFGVNL